MSSASYPAETTGATGTVTSIDVSGGTTGLTTSGGPVTTAGVITIAGTLNAAHGGTGATSLTAHGLLVGAGTGAVAVTAVGTTGQVLTGVTGADPVWAAPATAGTVTSVSGSGGTTGLTLTGGPITGSGTLTLGGDLVVANGGTGAGTFTAHGVLLGNGTSAFGVTGVGTTGQVLIGASGADPAWGAASTVAITSLTGDVTGTGPGATATTVAKIQGTVVSGTSGSGNVAFTTSPTFTTPVLGTPTSGTLTNCTGLPVAGGGTGQASLTVHTVLVGNGTSGITQIANGTTGQVLSAQTGADPIWSAATSGTVTSVSGSGGTTGLTLTGGPITGTGTLTLGGTLAVANGGTGVTSSTGTVAVVLSTSPTLVTPVLGVATATSINKMAITAPATSSTLAVADGKTLTASNTLTFTGTDSSSVAFSGGGTVDYVALTQNDMNIGNSSNVKQAINTSLIGAVQATAVVQTFTVTIASPGVFTLTAHGFVSGQKIYFTTTGALPTGLTASTAYWVFKIDANSFKVSTSLSNLNATTYVNTSGSQSGTHSAYSAGLAVDPASMDAVQATKLGYMRYLAGTAYAGGNTPQLTGANWTTTKFIFMPYVTADGTWRCRINGRGVWAPNSTGFTLTMAGMTTANFEQTLAFCQDDSSTAFAYRVYLADSGTTITISTATAIDNLSLSGEIELASKPTWAY